MLGAGASVQDVHDAFAEDGVPEEQIYLAIQAAEQLLRNPIDDITALELIVGGIAAVVLTGFGGYLVYTALNPPGSTPQDTATTLGEASSLATLTAVVM
jgi:hypothetical protein